MSADNFGPWLLLAAVAFPLMCVIACFFWKFASYRLFFLPIAALPALAAAFWTIAFAPLRFDAPTIGVNLFLDITGAILLSAVAALWTLAGVYALRDIVKNPKAGLFAIFWLLTLAGNLGVFITADLISFYFLFALASILAYGLIAFDETFTARRSGGFNLTFTILSEAFLLMGFVMLAAGEPHGSLNIRDCVAALPSSPWMDAVLAMVIAGFGLKIALVPFHGWMPLTYQAAPIPAAAVLSGAAVKAGVIGLINFLPFQSVQPFWGEILVVFGLVSAFYGVAIGVTQSDPKAVLGYSSISQMGVIATVLGMGLMEGDQTIGLKAAFYAAVHVLVKGGLFLAIGLAAALTSRLSSSLWSCPPSCCRSAWQGCHSPVERWPN